MQIRVGVIGGAGYTAGELLRLLVNHPQIEMVFIHSTSNADKPVTAVHRDLIGECDWQFTSTYSNEVDVVFLCVGHGDAKKTLAGHAFPESVKIIDLSQDYRLQANAEGFVYGLPELNRKRIQTAKSIANPGCFATAIQLALLPLAQAKKIKQAVHINAITGSTGAGQSLSASSHFSWRNNNISVYKAFKHQHLAEITESLTSLQGDAIGPLYFVPQRGDFTRGIFASLYTETNWTQEEALAHYQAYYASHPFVHVTSETIDLKWVVNTNKCVIQVEVVDGQLAIYSIIDNLLKGASGQAVQNMNLLFGLPENTGLRLKAVAF